MLNAPNLITTFSLLYILITFISRSKARGVVTRGIEVNYPNIKICIMAPTSEASNLNIQTNIISGVGRYKRKCLKSNWL